MKVNIGDVVRVSEGDYKGKLGIVKKIAEETIVIRVNENGSNLFIIECFQDEVKAA